MLNVLHLRNVLLICSLILIISCKKTSEKKSSESIAVNDTVQHQTPDMHSPDLYTFSGLSYEELRSKLPTFDLNQDISSRTVEELRILRNTIPARYGFLFMNADLRHYFYNTPWYTDIMKARWYGDCEESGLRKLPSIAYTQAEQAFMDRVKKLENEKLKENYSIRNGLKYANVNNIVNAWQFGGIPTALRQSLDMNGFAIVPNKNTQLFHIYEQNDYNQTQNFVSTDLYLQVFHMHFSFMLRGLEEEKFGPLVRDLLFGVYEKARELADSQSDPEVIDNIQYVQALYAVPLTLIGKEAEEDGTVESIQVAILGPYKADAETDLQNITHEASAPSALLPAYKDVVFPFDMFKPRGHYTRTEALQHYFRAMQWLQLAPYCLDDDTDLSRAIVAAYILANHQLQDGRSLMSLYHALLDPTTFLVGKPDNLSVLDLCDIIKKQNASSLQALLSSESRAAIRNEMGKLAATKNSIRPKKEETCRDKINFMPARFVLDNEILLTMSDKDSRPFPKGLDVMAAFGSKTAEDILVKELGEDKQWNKFLPNLEKMKAKYKNYEDWDETVYAKWISSLNTLLKPDQQYPSFMQLPAWNRKNLNTALASWTELKHDATLYMEQPMAAECGGGDECSPPPEPYVVGYVEPNVNYWKSAIELLDLTENLLSKNGLLINKLKWRQQQLRELCEFLLTVSEKEVRGEKLKEQEYRTIELVGTNVESITLSIIDSYNWENVSGPDKEIAVVADVFTNNAPGDRMGILHEGVGYGNDLYVVVEIDGYLYLAKGSTFSYYEFVTPIDTRFTDEEWQKNLKQGKQYETPSWLKNLIIPLDKSMQPKIEPTMYSSGC